MECEINIVSNLNLPDPYLSIDKTEILYSQTGLVFLTSFWQPRILVCNVLPWLIKQANKIVYYNLKNDQKQL